MIILATILAALAIPLARSRAVGVSGPSHKVPPSRASEAPRSLDVKHVSVPFLLSAQTEEYSGRSVMVRTWDDSPKHVWKRTDEHRFDRQSVLYDYNAVEITDEWGAATFTRSFREYAGRNFTADGLSELRKRLQDSGEATSGTLSAALAKIRCVSSAGRESGVDWELRVYDRTAGAVAALVIDAVANDPALRDDLVTVIKRVTQLPLGALSLAAAIDKLAVAVPAMAQAIRSFSGVEVFYLCPKALATEDMRAVCERSLIHPEQVQEYAITVDAFGRTHVSAILQGGGQYRELSSEGRSVVGTRSGAYLLEIGDTTYRYPVGRTISVRAAGLAPSSDGEWSQVRGTVSVTQVAGGFVFQESYQKPPGEVVVTLQTVEIIRRVGTGSSGAVRLPSGDIRIPR
jgi:hypothetical protein